MLKKLSLGLSLYLFAGGAIAQTCKTTSITETTPTTRFTPQGNGTVLDTQTNLIWKRCLEGQTWDDSSCTGAPSNISWGLALTAAQTLNTNGGFAEATNWRVPNIKELKSIVEHACNSPAINLTVFPNTLESTIVWSSSPFAVNADNAWMVSFYVGYSSWDYKGNNRQVHLVHK